MVRTFVVLAILLATSTAWAQVEPYNPYAPAMDDLKSPVAPDGTLNWPAFFKSAKMEGKFQSLFAQGICTGTRKVITTMLQENKVNVNQLPEASLLGLAVQVQPGILMMVDGQGQSCALVTHPAKVTKIHVGGTMPAAGIGLGMIVRLQARVDETGKGTERIDELEIVDGNPNITPQAVEAGELQSIVGVVTRAKRSTLQLKIGSGKLRRLTFELAEQPTISVDANSLGVILSGAEVKVKGRVYEGEGSLAKKTVFASEIEATETFRLAQPAADKPAADKVAAEAMQ